jgi:hypothetical protein
MRDRGVTTDLVLGKDSDNASYTADIDRVIPKVMDG